VVAIKIVVQSKNDTKNLCNTVPVASTNALISTNHIINAKLDSGATKHYFKSDHAKYLTSLTPINHGLTAILPNKTKVQASHQGQCNLHHHLSSEAKENFSLPKGFK